LVVENTILFFIKLEQKQAKNNNLNCLLFFLFYKSLTIHG